MTERQPDLGHEYDVSGVWSFHHQTALLFVVVFGIRPASRDCNCCVNAGYIVSFVLIMADGIPPKVLSKGEGPRPADDNAASDNFVSFSFNDRQFWKWGHTILSFRIMVEGILPKVLSKGEGPTGRWGEWYRSRKILFFLSFGWNTTRFLLIGVG